MIVADLGGEAHRRDGEGDSRQQATVTFTSPNPVVKPGMTAQVRIQ